MTDIKNSRKKNNQKKKWNRNFEKNMQSDFLWRLILSGIWTIRALKFLDSSYGLDDRFMVMKSRFEKQKTKTKIPEFWRVKFLTFRIFKKKTKIHLNFSTFYWFFFKYLSLFSFLQIISQWTQLGKTVQ